MSETIKRIRANLNTVIRGKAEKIDLLLACLLAKGHVLIEDLPGLGKTTLAKALARTVDGDFRRIQFTPDLLPTDIVGGSVYNPKEGSFNFHPGPIFTNILLADEINRASPRTQSSLLESMAEAQATIEGERHELPTPFIVLATQNPIEFQGTYPLPEAQLDRFLIHMDLGYADAETELDILYDQQITHPLDTISPVASRADVIDLQQQTTRVHVAREVGRYIVDVVRATREHADVQMGASPRGALGVFHLSQALALMDGRDHVRPEDVQAAAEPVLSHRIVLQTKARYGGLDKRDVINGVLKQVKVPT
jgi:MoxR-like ATPase